MKLEKHLISEGAKENEELVKRWLENLVLDKYREVYKNLNKDQKILVLFALKYNSSKNKIN